MISYLKKSLACLLILLFFSSCDQGCDQPYQFDNVSVSVDANPIRDGIITNVYNDTDGGQYALWHETGLITDGSRMVLSISGEWTPWNTGFDGRPSDGMKVLPECKLCAKKDGVDNCLCEPGKDSTSEPNADGSATNNDCTDAVNQDNPALCSCTKQHGNASDLNAYYIALDNQYKNETQKPGDLQNECKLNKGVGLYIGLFGADGATNPKRIYHLYSQRSVCDVAIVNGKCLDESGNDIFRYIYASPDNRIFIRDDQNGNNGAAGAGSNPQNNIYHQSREVVKLLINDNYYSDNHGFYNIVFLSGISQAKKSGLLEYIVGGFEDTMIGKIGSNGKRSGGIVEYLYKSIVQDSVFIRIVQMLLIMYVTIFGIGVLSGTVEMSRKDMSKRIMKIALVIFFTSQTSWYYYNQFVVGLFKDGMDTIITMFMNFVDNNVQYTDLSVSAQLDRADHASNATRFGYADSVIRNLYSTVITRKIWSLFFGVWFGVLYIPIIYVLIGYFTFVMLTAALMYVTSLLKLIFVITLGPLFIIASLFAQTEGMFKKWISYMGARSMEILVLFIILYMFLVLIDVGFRELLSYGDCLESYSLGVTSFDILKPTALDRSFIGWISALLKIAALIFILRLIMGKIPGFAASLVQISGTAGIGAQKSDRDAANSSATSIARDVTGKLFDVGKSAITEGLPYVARKAYGTAAVIGGATGLSDKWSALKEKVPFRSPLSIVRDRSINNAIEKSQELAKSLGLTGAAYDTRVRQETITLLNQGLSTNQGKAKSAVLGIDADAIAKKLDDKLVKEPLKKIVKEEAAKMKAEDADSILLGAEMREELKRRVSDRAATELHSDPLTVEKYLTNMKGLMRDEGELSSSEAAKKFAGRPELQSKFIEHLAEERLRSKLDIEKSSEEKFMGGTRERAEQLGRSIKDLAHGKNSEADFARKAKYGEEEKKYLERDKEGYFGYFKNTRRSMEKSLSENGVDVSKGFNPIKRIEFLDKIADKARVYNQKKLFDEKKEPVGGVQLAPEVGPAAMPAVTPEAKGASITRRILASGAMDFKADQKERRAAAHQEYLISGYIDDARRVKQSYEDEMAKFQANESVLSRAQIEKNRNDAEDLIKEKIKSYAGELKVALSQDHENIHVARLDAVAGVGAPNAVPAALLEPEAISKLDELSKMDKKDMDIKAAAEYKDADNMFVPVKQNLKDLHAANKEAIQEEISSLQASIRSNKSVIDRLKNKKNRGDELSKEEQSELSQAEYESSKAETKLGAKQHQKTIVEQELSKVS